jgi:glycosyltransferase involved in cell wall biosynthesis
MKAVILVPFRTDNAERQANWDNVHKNLATLGIPIVEGDNKGRVFERARARNVAAELAGNWDVALFCDADILVPRDQLEAALMRSYLTGAYVVAYSHLHYLTRKGTEQRLRGGGVNSHPEFCESDEMVGLTWECAYAVRRDIWDTVGGFDERFRGYGGQVAAFFYAYATFGGRSRINGNAYHMDHPLVDRSKEKHFQDNCDLTATYLAAVDDIPAMREVLRVARA